MGQIDTAGDERGPRCGPRCGRQRSVSRQFRVELERLSRPAGCLSTLCLKSSGLGKVSYVPPGSQSVTVSAPCEQAVEVV